MANNLLTPLMITSKALMMLVNNLVFSNGVIREYDDQFAQSGAKIGATLNIRKPARFTVSTGAALAIQDYVESQVPLVVNTQDHVDVNFTSQELTLSLDMFSERVGEPAMEALANKIDFSGLTMAYQSTGNTVGTPGTTPATALVWLLGGAKMDENAAPRDSKRFALMNPQAQAATVDGLKGLFQSAERIKEQYEAGEMGKALGFTFKMDQNVNQHTVGPLGGTPLVNGAQTGTYNAADTSASYNLVTDGWTAAAAARLNKGDVFTIATVFAVNPQNRQSTGSLQQFVVTANVSSDGAGNATVPIWPIPVFTTAYQNVTSVTNNIPDNAAITVVGTAATTYPQNLEYHKNAFCLATVDLEDVSQYGAFGARRNWKGISLRLARQYRIGTDDVPARFDVLYGWKPFYPEIACRVWG